MNKIPVLFCEEKSNYKKFDYFDCFDFKKNALTFKGNEAVICHPPCQHWSKLKYFTKRPIHEKRLAIWAMLLVSKNGGILEQPKGSYLFNIISKLIKEKKINGFIISINQHWFGHPCKKETLLYINGLNYNDLPALELSFNAVEYCITSSKKNKLKQISNNWRNRTPINLIHYFKNIIDIINKKKP